MENPNPVPAHLNDTARAKVAPRGDLTTAQLVSRLAANVPQELRDFDHFVVWRREPKPKPDDPNATTKVPYVATLKGALRKAQANNPATWASFADAITALNARKSDKLSGIGFVPNTEDPFCGIDLDHCADATAREIAPWARAIVDSFASYTEFSPSGTGIRIWIQGAMPDELDAQGVVITAQKGRKIGDVEAYSNEHYLTLTGDHVEDTPETIEARQDELDGFVAKYLTKQVAASRVNGTNGDAGRVRPLVTMSDRELLDKMFASKSGAQINELWRGGMGNHPSDSEARIALLNHLAWWTHGDAAQMDRLYRASGRFGVTTPEDKWERLGAGEIDNAIAFIGETGYDPNARGVPWQQGGTRQAQQGSAVSGEKPFIVVRNRQLDVMTRETLGVLYDANAGEPFIFRRNATLARVRTNEEGVPLIEELTPTILRTMLAEIADFGFWQYNKTKAKAQQEAAANVTVDGDTPEDVAAAKAQLADDADTGAFDKVNMTPPKELTEAILTQAAWDFPALVGIIEAPALRPDGTIICAAGYDAATRLIYAPATGLRVPAIADTPSKDEVKRAVAAINDIIGEFPYDCDASRAHAFALLLTGVARSAIDGLVPMALMTAPASGTGKGLLSSIAPAIITGHEPAVLPLVRTDDEWRKQITSKLMTGAAFIRVDEVQGPLGNGPLQAALTTSMWEDRALGGNRIVSVRQRAIWLAMGNNIQLSGDMPRRVYRIRLDAQLVHPERRNTFKIKNLPQHIRSHRGEILGALLTIARAWYAAGRPEAQVTAMGGFEEWAQTIGGMLQHAGVSGFLSNLDEMYEQADTERPQWGAFLEAWWGIWRTDGVTANKIAERIAKASLSSDELRDDGDQALLDALPEDLASVMMKMGELTRKLGYKLRKMDSMRCEMDDGAIIYATTAGQDKHNKTKLWCVVKTDAPTPPSPTTSTSGEGASENGKSITRNTNAHEISNEGTLRVMAGDDSIPTYGEKKVNGSDVIEAHAHTCVEPSGAHHPLSPAPTPSSQTDSVLKAAGDTFASPAKSSAGQWMEGPDADCDHDRYAKRTLRNGSQVCGKCGAKYVPALDGVEMRNATARGMH